MSRSPQPQRSTKKKSKGRPRSIEVGAFSGSEKFVSGQPILHKPVCLDNPMSLARLDLRERRLDRAGMREEEPCPRIA